MARTTGDKKKVKSEIQKEFGYDLDRTLNDIRPGYRFDISCQGTVPEAVIAFLESNSYEDAVRNAVSLGGDSDTLACITGGILGLGSKISRAEKQVLDELAAVFD